MILSVDTASRPKVKVINFYDNVNQTVIMEAHCVECGKQVMRRHTKNGLLVSSYSLKCKCG